MIMFFIEYDLVFCYWFSGVCSLWCRFVRFGEVLMVPYIVVVVCFRVSFVPTLSVIFSGV